VTVLWDETQASDQGEGMMLHHYYTRKTEASEQVEGGDSGGTFVAPKAARTAVLLFKGVEAPGTVCDWVALAPQS
jgi:hypothetical protein